MVNLSFGWYPGDMDLLSLFALSIGLAMDAFAVAIGLGMSLPHVRPTQVARVALAFGGFQGLMPVVGWLAGQTLAGQPAVAAVDHWIAFVLLSALGGKMIVEARRNDEAGPEPAEKDPTKSATLLLLAIATSIDALIVGMSLALLRVTIWSPALVIGATAGLFAIVGVHLGGRVGRHFGPRVELLGGLALIAIGARILLEHLFWPTT